MFAGYYSFEHEGKPTLGLFIREPMSQFYSVRTFHSVVKVLDPNDVDFVVEDPFLRFVQELFLDRSIIIAVDLKAKLTPIYVLHVSYFINQHIIFRPGMVGIFSISKQRLEVAGWRAGSSLAF